MQALRAGATYAFGLVLGLGARLRLTVHCAKPLLRRSIIPYMACTSLRHMP